MADEAGTIERCADIADQAVTELTGMLGGPRARKSHYDKQTGLQIKYAIRWCRRIGQRIRALNPNPEDDTATGQGDGAVKLLREMRPMIEQMARDSHWRTTMLAKIDAVIASSETGA